MKKPTSHDVAERAGVSQSTVSMILNGKGLSSFSDDTIRRVTDAARHLGYKGVRRERSAPTGDTIVLFCPVLSNPYYASLTQAVEQAAYKHGFRTLICTTYRSGDIERRHLGKIDPAEVAGIIFANIPLHIQKVEEIGRKLPVVVIGDRDDRINVDTVEVNSYRSGVAVANHLIGLGHRNIQFVSTSLNSANTIRVKRMEGIRDTLEKSVHGCRFTVKSKETTSLSDISAPDIEHTVGYSLARECLGDTATTAIVGVNDMVAYGVMDALLEAGFRIPEDYSVCGFDNIFPSMMRQVSLSSIENYMIQKGHDAFDMLLSRIKQQVGQEDNGRDSVTRVEYQPRLLIRASTGPART